MTKLIIRILVGACSLVAAVQAIAVENHITHGLSLHGDLKYGRDFEHFDYVNPEAPKGGEIRLAWVGTFDSLNPFILKGITPPRLESLVYDSLLERAEDQPSTMYGELAESVEVAADGSWVIYTLRQGARWHDGQPIIPEDVIFSLKTLQMKGAPFWRSYYENIEKAEQVGKRGVKLTFAGEINKELPLIAGQFSVFPKHYWESRNFEDTSLEAPLGSGPYRVDKVEGGRFITYKRVEDYWGRDLPVNKGRHNFDSIHFDYYRDSNVAVEALKAGEYDYRDEGNSKDWATSYNVPVVDEGRLIKQLFPHQRPRGMSSTFWLNTRRSKFSDRRVRQALAHVFDFEWSNTNLFYGQYSRNRSYFTNSELASSGLPAGRELEILEEYRDRVPNEVFTDKYAPPTMGGSGQIRQSLRIATRLLRQAGWGIVNGQLIHTETSAAMEIEFLLPTPSLERIVNPLIANLERLGISGRIRTVDRAQYQNRVQEFDFDVIVGSLGQSSSPGNEQRDYWTSTAADAPGSRNWAGIKDPVIDELVERLIQAPNRTELVALTRSMDRVLLWGHYVIPGWHISAFRTLRWDKFGMPFESAPYRGDLFVIPWTWWYDPERATRLDTQ